MSEGEFTPNDVNENENLSVPDSEYTPAKENNLNFFDKIIEFITGVSTDERIKLRKLKEINKKLKRLKFKFYSYKQDQVLQSFPHFIYEIYRLSQNVAKFLDTKNHSKSIKQFIFELFSTQEQKQISLELDQNNINELIFSSSNSQTAIDTIKAKLNKYVKSFDSETIKKINSTYNQICDLSNIINFDWYFMLHKFDSNITELNFNYKPEFELIEGKYIMDELITLNDYLETIDFQKEWTNVYNYIKTISDDDSIVKIIKKIVQLCRILKKDNYLLYMIQLIYKNPFFEPKKFPSHVKVVQDYIYEFQKDIKQIVDSAIKTLKRDKVNKLLLSIFHTTAIIRMKHYNQKLNDVFAKKNITTLKYVDPMNYLKAFVLDFCKGEIKARIDFFLIKGNWSTNSLSSDYSRILDHFNNLSDRIVQFDNSCAEDEEYGKSIRKLTFAVSHDPNAKVMVNKVIYKMDQEAAGLMKDSIRLFINVSEKLKVLIDDYKSKSPAIIINIKDIKWDFPEEISTDLVQVYKKIYNFINLLKFYIKNTA